MTHISRRSFSAACAVLALPHASRAFAQDAIKIGFVGEMSGPFAQFGQQMQTGIKEYRQRGLADAGIKLLGTGDISYESSLPAMGDGALDTVTVYPYSAVHKSAMNEKFVSDFMALGAQKEQPNVMGVSAYDGMAAIYAALKKTSGKADGDTLIAALKGLKFESPRGPLAIDATTGDVIQNEYIRRVQKVNGQLQNVEFETIPPSSH